MEKNEEYPNIFSAEVDNNSPKDELQELLQTLEQRSYWNGGKFVKYDGFWIPLEILRPTLSTQKYFKAKDSDIILASFPKSGTTWLKALTFSIANRNIYATIDQNPLLITHPQEVVPCLEFNLYLNKENPDLQHFSNPRIFSTHIPFKSLPDSIRESECKIIYVCRNPLDQFISERQFVLENKIQNDTVLPLKLEESFDMFCQGIQVTGPVWDHTLGYWNVYLKNPEKVLFLKYEDLKHDITFYLKKIAEFLGCPFSLEEENQGVTEQISKLCSFENLKNLDVNKTGYFTGVMKNSSFFRKGEVGDWTNYLTPAMAERFKNIMESKMEGSEKDAVPLEFDEAFDMLCDGILPFGPFWDHMLGYWNAHLKSPEKVLFLKYEDLKEDITFYIKKIAEFLGCPFSLEEEKQGLIEQISKLCSFETLKNLEVNKTGYHIGVLKRSSFFRKGEIGDWTNYLTPAMAERFQKIMESKMEGSGLMFSI
ncbi:hypothetical protein DH2020_036475 [Rehmannia glutinosa]|uniref:Sulfotransferase n=1 Tax=Rehmannia glutinosa TaxID=99300 RepID=A0ABR0V5B7_REHGL